MIHGIFLQHAVLLVAYLFIAIAQLGAFVHFAGRWYANYRIQKSFVEDMATNHLPHIYEALRQIAEGQGIELKEPPLVKFVKINGEGK